MHQRHAHHFESLAVDVVALYLQMQQIGMVLRNELGKHLRALPADDEIVENQSFTASLIDYQLLDALPLEQRHLN